LAAGGGAVSDRWGLHCKVEAQFFVRVALELIAILRGKLFTHAFRG
jgi:hypothetical protein